MARPRLLHPSQNTKTLQQLNVARGRDSIALQRLRQVGDRARRHFYLLEEEHPFLRQHPKKRCNVIEGHHPAGRKQVAAIRQASKIAPALKECIHSFNPDFSVSHVSPVGSILSENAPQSVRSRPSSPPSPRHGNDDGDVQEPRYTT